MAFIDRFLPVLGFAALLRADPGLADAPYEEVRRDMESLIRQALEGGRPVPADAPAPGVPDGPLNDALFAACAFADEMLLTSRWSGRPCWARETLQQRFFRSADAGEAFFRRLEALSARLNQERRVSLAGSGGSSVSPASSGVADRHGADSCAEGSAAAPVPVGEEPSRQALEVYAACLALGYTGRYYHPGERETLGGLTRAGRDAVLEGAARRARLFPEVYSDPPRNKPPVLGYLGRMAVLWGAPALITLVFYGLYNLLLADRLAAVEALFR